MKKRTIVLASLLKPVDDTRMTEKLATTLATINDAEITVIGYPGQSSPPKGLKAISLKPFKRISFGRWWARINVLQLTLQLKSEYLIVNTHELLIVGIVNRILFGTKILYDVQENHYRNIRYGGAFSPPWALLLASWIRLKERCCAPFYHAFLLAERAYSNEMNFFGERFTVIENKCLLPPSFERRPDPDSITLLFSGTLATSTGVFEAIQAAKVLHEVEPRIRLIIIGYSAQVTERSRILQATGRADFISVHGLDNLVAHQEIMDAISKSDFGIISYPASPHTANATPTKLYEYLACRLPILLTPNAGWLDICRRYAAALPVDFGNIHPDSLLSAMKEQAFYTSPPQDCLWEEEGKRLIDVIQGL